MDFSVLEEEGNTFSWNLTFVDFSNVEEEEGINLRICHFHQMALTSQQITADVTENLFLLTLQVAIQ